MGRPKSLKRKDLDLRFRADLLLKLRVKRASLFYGGNTSALVANTVLIRLQEEERHLSLPLIDTVEAPITRRFSAYAVLPKQFKHAVDQLNILIQRLGDGANEDVVMAEYERLFPSSKKTPAQAAAEEVDPMDRPGPDDTEFYDPSLSPVTIGQVPVETSPETQSVKSRQRRSEQMPRSK